MITRLKQVFMNKKGVNFIELVIVISIVAAFAAFVIPNYERSLDKAQARNAKVNLQAIQGALKIYEAKHGDLSSLDLNGQDAINAALGLKVSDGDLDYHCYLYDPDDINRFVCDAANNPKGYVLRQYINDGTIVCNNLNLLGPEGQGRSAICEELGY